MSERFERMFTFGAPPVNSRNRDTWTDEVVALYQRLQDGDDTALAPLLEFDMEFLREGMAIAAIVGLKYDRTIPARVARAGLQRIANVIRKRPGRRGAKLPFGDRLLAEAEHLTSFLESNNLIKLAKDREALRSRVLELLEPPKPKPATHSFVEWDRKRVKLPRPEDAIPIPEHLKVKVCDAILAGTRGVRKPRSWAKQALAHYYNAQVKDIEKRIARDLKSGKRKR